jgi:hypothetical protein
MPTSLSHIVTTGDLGGNVRGNTVICHFSLRKFL